MNTPAHFQPLREIEPGEETPLGLPLMLVAWGLSGLFGFASLLGFFLFLHVLFEVIL